jgi:hypothetical protein
LNNLPAPSLSNIYIGGEVLNHTEYQEASILKLKNADSFTLSFKEKLHPHKNVSVKKYIQDACTKWFFLSMNVKFF